MATQRITLPATHPPTLSATLRTQINHTLLATNAIPSIHAALLHECQASGWLDAIRARVLALLRSGQCGSYGEVMHVVMHEMKGDVVGAQLSNLGAEEYGDREGTGFVVKTENGVNGVNGNGSKEEDLRVPARVVQEGVRIVRGALDEVVDIEVGEGEGR